MKDLYEKSELEKGVTCSCFCWVYLKSINWSIKIFTDFDWKRYSSCLVEELLFSFAWYALKS